MNPIPCSFRKSFFATLVAAAFLFSTVPCSQAQTSSSGSTASGGGLGVFVPGSIQTFAGGEQWIYAGDGGPASAAAIYLPLGVTVDASHTVFVADTQNNRIRKVDGTSGIIQTIAGNGVVGTTGDNGPALQAELDGPSSIALDSAGNIFFTDTGNNAVRKLTLGTGILTTVAGTLGNHGYSGDGGPATAALLYKPNGIAFDASGNLLIADTGNNVIRKLNVTSGVLTTVVGNGAASYSGDGGPALTASLNGPWSITPTAAGELYIADQNNNCIRKVDAAGNITTPIGLAYRGFGGDGGPSAQAQLNEPASVVIDAAGNLYIADTGNNRIRKVDAATGLTSTVVGTGAESMSGDGGPADQAGIYAPYTLALDAQGTLYFADVFHNRIRSVAANAGTLAYNPTGQGRTSDAQSQVFENNGTTALTIAAVTPVSDSVVDPAATTCVNGLVLAPLGRCTVSARFAPTVVGYGEKGFINITSDAQNSPAVLTLLGEVDESYVTSTALVSSSNPALEGNPITFSVQVTSPSSVPTGTVTLLDGAASITTLTLQNGTAAVTLSNLAAGTHNLTAAYNGDFIDATSTSAPLVQVVNAIVASKTAVVVSSNANPVLPGVSLRLTAQVSVTTAGTISNPIVGTVVFMEGNTVLGTGTFSGGIATLDVANLAVGTHAITASFRGNTDFADSASAVFNQSVQQATPAVVLASSGTSSLVGDAVQLSVTVTNGQSAFPPTGTVTLSESGSVVASASLVATTGLVNFSLPALSVGSHTFTASYSGDSRTSAGTSNTLVQTVALRPTTTSLTLSGDSLVQGQTITLVGVVLGSGSRAATGMVVFQSGTTVLGTAALNASGVGTLTLSPGVGSFNVVASYAGDALYGASTSGSASFTVGTSSGSTTPPFAIAITPPSLTLVSGQRSSIQITATGASTFTDVLRVGCAGLPAAATCTFSQNQMTLLPGATSTVTVTVDTGDPLGAGSSASLNHSQSGLLFCLLPGGACFGLALFRTRRKLLRSSQCKLLLMLLSVGGLVLLSGCGNSLSQSTTPAGSYNFSVTVVGAATQATQTGNVSLVVR